MRPGTVSMTWQSLLVVCHQYGLFIHPIVGVPAMHEKQWIHIG